jgi:type I restriction enzyme R subunit
MQRIDICDLFHYACNQAGWDQIQQIRREVYTFPGPVVVRGNLSSLAIRRNSLTTSLSKTRFTAVVEAKDNKHSINGRPQQALGYAEILDVPARSASNGTCRTQSRGIHGEPTEIEYGMEAFPDPQALWDHFTGISIGSRRTSKALSSSPIHTSTKSHDIISWMPLIGRSGAVARAEARAARLGDGRRRRPTFPESSGACGRLAQPTHPVSSRPQRLVDQTLVNDFKPFGWR